MTTVIATTISGAIWDKCLLYAITGPVPPWGAGFFAPLYDYLVKMLDFSASVWYNIR